MKIHFGNYENVKKESTFFYHKVKNQKKRRKYLEQNGETIIETLFSLLMVVLALTMLAGAILSAAKVNSHVKNQDTAFSLENASNVPGLSVSILHQDGSRDQIPVKGIKSAGNPGYHLYEKEEIAEEIP